MSLLVCVQLSSYMSQRSCVKLAQRYVVHPGREYPIILLIPLLNKQGLHVNDIAAFTNVNPGKLARVLRVLATKHIFREVAPDVFANNRLSSVLDTRKDIRDILSK